MLLKILAVSDTYASWTAKMELSQDLNAAGLGVRTQRFVLIVDDLKVVHVGVSSIII